MFRILREIAATVRMANDLAQQSGSNGPRWSVFITNRSFILQVIALLFALAGLFGLPIPIGAADLGEIVLLAGYLVTQGWALAERLFGKTRVVWNMNSAKEAMHEANAIKSKNDALTKALKDAGAL